MKQTNPEPDRDDRTDETTNAVQHDPLADKYFQAIRNFVNRELEFAKARLASTGSLTMDSLFRAVERELMATYGGKAGDAVAVTYSRAYLKALLLELHNAKNRLAATTSTPAQPAAESTPEAAEAEEALAKRPEDEGEKGAERTHPYGLTAEEIRERYGVPRTTLQSWQEKDDVPNGPLWGQTKKDSGPSHKLYYPEDWVKKRVGNWKKSS